MTRPILFDTTALIGVIRNPARLAGFRRAAGSQWYYPTAVTIAELQSGTRTAQQAALIDQLARLFAADWSAAGRLIARAISRNGAMEPRDLYPDVPIAQVAGRLGAAVITENVKDLSDWIALGRLGAAIANN